MQCLDPHLTTAPSLPRVRACGCLSRLLQGLRSGRLQFLVEDGAGHHELAWQWRLTGAMRFLFNPWWDE